MPFYLEQEQPGNSNNEPRQTMPGFFDSCTASTPNRFKKSQDERESASLAPNVQSDRVLPIPFHNEKSQDDRVNVSLVGVGRLDHSGLSCGCS